MRFMKQTSMSAKTETSEKNQREETKLTHCIIKQI